MVWTFPLCWDIVATIDIDWTSVDGTGPSKARCRHALLDTTRSIGVALRARCCLVADFVQV
jgi:hypothetical protein